MSEATNYAELERAELVQAAKDAGIPANGKSEDLVKALEEKAAAPVEAGEGAEATDAGEAPTLPIEGYDDLTVTEILEKLPELDDEDLAAVKAYEADGARGSVKIANYERESAAAEQDESSVGDDLVEFRRPIVDVNDRGDWTDPFSDLKVLANSDVSSSGARRDGDEAVIVVAEDQADQYREEA